jgi:hypothetical protein
MMLSGRSLSLVPQRGVVLPIALILLTVMTLSGVTAISVNQKNMRIAAHQSQYLDAFLAAEAGLQAAADALEAAVAGGLAPPTDDTIWSGSAITDRIPSITWTDAGSAEPYGTDLLSGYFVEDIADVGGLVRLRVVGITEGIGPREGRTLVMTFEPGSSGTALFEDVLTACRHVDVIGSGSIRSYDSLAPELGELYRANISNRLAGGRIELNGNGSIFGSARSTAGGNIGGTLMGEFVASGNVTANSGTSVCGRISATGDVSTSGNFALGPSAHSDCSHVTLATPAGIQGRNVYLTASAEVDGNVDAHGNLSMSGNARIHHDANVAGNYNLQNSGTVQGTLTYGGSGTQTGGGSIGTLVHRPGLVVPSASGVPTRTCEPEGVSIRELMTAKRPSTDAILSGKLPELKSNSSDQLIPHLRAQGGFEPGVQQDLDVDPAITVAITGNVDLKGWRNLNFPANQNVNLRVDGDFGIGGSAGIVIPSNVDVTLWVGGDVNLAGSGSISLGANSTLSLYVKGESKLGNNPFHFPNNRSVVERTDDDGQTYMAPSVALYSDIHASDGVPGHQDDISVTGASAIYTAIYAPYARVGIGGSGELRGAVWAHDIKVFGSGSLRYDVQLARAQTGAGGGGGTGGLTRLSWSEAVH